ncbi:PAS domain-containing protein [Dawidia soli]|uniref:PAS domain-containing protein n=1 Tax=Dawidia soli TaxID=2782352 RepID=A0AAP2GHE9_9BACT|nr:PAS domain-containing protein [Dawidia soli]MBT1686345.1 PAS domain-containing protein [Dawidia soli]
MKFLSYALIKKNYLDTLNQRIASGQQEVAGATRFVKEIEQGNLEVQYNGDDKVDNGNLLASSLISMRDQMKRFSQEERQRNWVTEGLAKFVDILRSKNDDIKVLAEDIISNLIKYMGANQGALYVVNDDRHDDMYLEMLACYAYDRKKHLTQRIEIGEGVTGQVVLEKRTTYLTVIPKDFIRITSGLGEASPKALLIVPLKIEEQVLGVIEIASFTEIKRYKIDFVEKLAESIAATVLAVKTNDRTRKLLEETQQQAEQMRSQEEEMRQNMEELAATQEEMHRVLTEVQGKERYMIDLIDASTDSILTVDKNMQIINCNTQFRSTYAGMDIGKGFDLTRIFATAEEKERYRGLYQRVFEGESFEMTDHVRVNGTDMYYQLSYSPIRNDAGDVMAAAVFAKDVTQIIKAKNDAQHQSEELKAQEEELRQNMEELSATQEEMQRILQSVQAQERYLNELLNASTDSIYTLDKDLKLISYNKAFGAALEGMGVPLQKGFEMLSLFPEGEEREKQRALYLRALKGETFEVTTDYTANGVTSYHTSINAPLYNDAGEIFALASYSHEVTQQVEMQRQTQENERYLNELINAATDSIYTLDKSFRLISFNRVFGDALESMGIPLKKGFEILSLFPDKAEQDKQRALYERALKGESFEEISTYSSNGETSYYANSFAPLRNEAGEVFAIAGFAKDITERVNLQKQAEKRESVLGLTTILSEADERGVITLVNDKLCEVSKYKREELIGKPHSVFRHPDMPKELFSLFWQTIKAGQVFKGIIKNRAKDGTHYWVDATIVPVKDDTGKIVQYIGARYHITDDTLALTLYNRQAEALKLPKLF